MISRRKTRSRRATVHTWPLVLHSVPYYIQFECIHTHTARIEIRKYRREDRTCTTCIYIHVGKHRYIYIYVYRVFRLTENSEISQNLEATKKNMCYKKCLFVVFNNFFHSYNVYGGHFKVNFMLLNRATDFLIR